VYRFTREETDLEAIRERIKWMNGERLKHYGQAAAWIAARYSRRAWKVALAEARAEWRRCHPSG